ncbi:tetratricopeptide repeat protein [Streptomyces gilvosporeus]|uniref:Tetratricopeptide repeat protein n=1 Tax=Streptomyces gilvosporeus TaxID=553510 RepID=A0A1V0TUP1_9ACTN|nr:hypothetical protein [Streptomyces gilvosporeus]ARF56488.1 hypothetical protein B1H19_21980 [Streptomyces gilvosporeus]
MDRSWIGGHNIQIGDVTGHVTILLERPSFRLELLRPVASPELPAKARHQPSYLLHPGNQVVPYRQPVADLKTLADWRDGGEAFSVLLLHGPGGQGKTRTAQHFASCAVADGWSVAQARDLSTAAPALSPAEGAPAERLLIVVDYAERWRYPSLLAMLESTRGAGRARVVRVLLLARSGTPLWDRLEAELDGLDMAYAPPMSLGGFAAASRAACFAEARAAFARALDVPEVSPPVPSDLADPVYASPLTLHMAALAGVVAASQNEARPADISRYLLLHERRRWNASAAAGTVRTLVVLATLFGPARTRESARALLLAAGAADGPAEADRALTAHRALYPSDRHLAPLRPDRFAEDFLGWHLGRDQDAREDLAALLTGDGTPLQDGDIRQALIVLANAARHEPVRDLLDTVVTRRADLAESSPAVLLAVAEHLPLGTALAFARRPIKGVELSYARLRLAQRVAEAVPDGAPPDIDIMRLWLLGRELLEYGEYAQAADVLGRAVRQARAYRDHPEIGDPAELAELLNLYAQTLAFSGREQQSVHATTEAVELLREQPAVPSDVDPSRHKELLARSLANHANALAETAGTGNLPKALAAAEEAIALYRELAAEDSDAYGGALVRAEERVARLLHEVGRPEEALQVGLRAADMLRRLSAEDPEEHREAYGNTLHNLGLSLKATGQSEQAVRALSEAADHYRYLAQHIPLRFLDRLAGCLLSLSEVLEGLGRVGERVRVLRELVAVERQMRERGPVPDERRLAVTMFCLGQQLAIQGDDEHAVAPLTEATELLRSLAERNPGSVPVLSEALIRLGSVQSALGDRTAAEAAEREAVALYLKHDDASEEGTSEGRVTPGRWNGVGDPEGQ